MARLSWPGYISWCACLLLSFHCYSLWLAREGWRAELTRLHIQSQQHRRWEEISPTASCLRRFWSWLIMLNLVKTSGRVDFHVYRESLWLVCDCVLLKSLLYTCHSVIEGIISHFKDVSTPVHWRFLTESTSLMCCITLSVLLTYCNVAVKFSGCIISFWLTKLVN